MSTETPQEKFARFNVDPALAEMVEDAGPGEMLEGILRLDDPAQVPAGFRVVSKFNRICTGRFRADDAWAIRRHPNVASLKAGTPLGIQEGEDWSSFPSWLPGEGQSATNPRFTGRGCVVAALDFGLDFAHPNFRNPDGSTRVIGFWNQGADYDAKRPNRFGYGRIYSRAEIDAALRTSDPYATLGYHPASSDGGLGSHGTHTLDIAAGNGRARGSRPSLASGADIVFVHLSTPQLDTVGDLGDSVRLLEGLDYVAEAANGHPWVVNLSVGRTAGSHDGTSLVEQGMHELLRLGKSRAIVQSAGNYRSANLAVEGWLRDGERRDLGWKIDAADTTANELDAWYSGRDRFVVAIRPPGTREFTKARLGEVADIVCRGETVGRIYHRRDDPNNHDNHVEVFLYEGAPSGTWTVRLIGEYVISGRFHAWIERDLAKPGAQSRFDAKITTKRYTLGTIATSPLTITVGAYDDHAGDKALAHFSSSGPTRDERIDKPELLAPGVRVVAARSIPRNARKQTGMLIARSGTSMATPHVTATVAAMLEAAGRPVTIDEIRDCLARSAQPVRDVTPGAQCAWGRLDSAKAILAMRALKPRPHEGEDMNTNSMNELLAQVGRAVPGTAGSRRDLETAFLRQLLRAIPGGNVFPDGMTPADLFRSLFRDRSAEHYARNVLDVLGLPAQRPSNALRAGDWMLRFAPGTGDVGHVSVLTSDDLLTRSALAADGIDAESMQPGFYGRVIEVGTSPDGGGRSIARRLLDSRGRVSPYTMFLRPGYADTGVETETAEGESGESGDSGEGGGPSLGGAWSPPKMFNLPSWLNKDQRTVSRSGEASAPAYAGDLLSEAFTFEPTADLPGFGPKTRAAWHALMDFNFNRKIARATALITAANPGTHLRFFNPAQISPKVALTSVNVHWGAIPRRLGSFTRAIYEALDKLDSSGVRTQDEYCEWVVFRNAKNQIVRVVFTSEPPEYYDFLYYPGVPGLSFGPAAGTVAPDVLKFTRELLVKAYRERCSDNSIKLSDLEGPAGFYNPNNKWNNQHCVHLQQDANTLGAQIDIAARAAVVRSDASGKLHTDINKLLACDGFGDPRRQSDPTIGDNVNKLARENRFLTLENPIGLYMTRLDTSGWKTPDGADPQKFWRVLRGKSHKDPGRSMIVRADFSVPASRKYTVSDIKIGGVPIEFGSQIAEHVEMRLGVRFGPKDQDLGGGASTAPKPVVC
jgi:subtilisin family serine protease